jgi:hypothetical protein
MAATSARAKRSSLPSSHGGEDKTIQERGRHPHDGRCLVRPPGRRRSCAAGGAGGTTGAADLRTARPSPVRETGSHTPLGGRRQHWRRHQSQRNGAATRLAYRPKELGAARDRTMAQPAVHLHEAGNHPSPPPNAGGRSGKECRLHGHPEEVDNDGRLKDEPGRHG